MNNLNHTESNLNNNNVQNNNTFVYKHLYYYDERLDPVYVHKKYTTIFKGALVNLLLSILSTIMLILFIYFAILDAEIEWYYRSDANHLSFTTHWIVFVSLYVFFAFATIINTAIVGSIAIKSNFRKVSVLARVAIGFSSIGVSIVAGISLLFAGIKPKLKHLNIPGVK